MDQVGRRSELILGALVFAAAIVLALPVWLVVNQPTQDGPSHLAELYILTHASDPLLSKFYVVQWAAVPNLGIELFVVVLSKIFSVETCVKLFVSAAVAMWALGCAAIQRALFGRLQPTALLGAVFAYNTNLVYGFWSCYFGLGLALLVFALWIVWSERLNWARTLLFAIAMVVVYFCHLIAAATLLGLMIAYEARPTPRSGGPTIKAQAVRLCLIMAPVIVLLFLRPSSAGGAFHWSIIGEFPQRFRATLDTGLNRSPWEIVAVLLVLFGLGIKFNIVRVHPAMRPLLIGFAVICLLLPEWIAGGWGLHVRLPAMGLSLLCASTDLRLSTATARALGVGAVALIVGLSAALNGNWQQTDRWTSVFRSALRTIPKGARVFSVVVGDGVTDIDQGLFTHIDSYAVVDRQAFATLLLTTRGQHVVHSTAPFSAIGAQTSIEGLPPNLSSLALLRDATADPLLSKWHGNILNWPCHFDVAILLGPAPEFSALRGLSLIHQGPMFGLYAVERSSRCSDEHLPPR